MTLTTDLTDTIPPLGDDILAHPRKGGTWRMVKTVQNATKDRAIHVLEQVRYFQAQPAIPATDDEPEIPAVEAQWSPCGPVEAIAVRVDEVSVPTEADPEVSELSLERTLDNGAWPLWRAVGDDPELLRLYAALCVWRADSLEAHPG